MQQSQVKKKEEGHETRSLERFGSTKIHRGISRVLRNSQQAQIIIRQVDF